MRCDEVMTTRVETIDELDAVLVAADAMRRANVGFLPVLSKDGYLVGVLTDRDIAVRLVAEDLPTGTAVRSIMTRYVVVCRESDDIHHAEQLMGEKGVSRIVCLDARGRLAGVLSLSDVAPWDAERVAQALVHIRERERLHAH